MRRAILTTVLAAVLAGAPLFVRASEPDRAAAAWREVPWPFPMDQWGTGKAFRCGAADCGSDVTLYIRAKIGFCNCTTGVADDEELDRISDFDLVGGQFTAQGPGRLVTVAWMNGRSRAFSIARTREAEKALLSIGFNDCRDAIVATALIEPNRAHTIEPAVLEFLNSATVVRWAKVALGQ